MEPWPPSPKSIANAKNGSRLPSAREHSHLLKTGRRAMAERHLLLSSKISAANWRRVPRDKPAFPMKKQNWTTGETVKVGFLVLRVLAGPIPTPGNYRADEYALENLKGTRFYRFTPHAGCFRVASRQEAMTGPANY